jgi:putative membrane protein
MLPWLFVLTVAGLVLAGVLVAVHGAAQVGAAFLSVGWGLALVVAARAVQITTAGLAWRAVALPTAPPVPASRFVLLRFVRESINALLPVAQVGGDIIGARLLTFYGPPGSVAGAGVIVDIFLQVATQFVFTLIGFGVLFMLVGSSPLMETIAVGLLIAAPTLLAFFLAQRAGGLRLVEKLLVRLAAQRQWFDLGRIGELDAKLRLIHRNGRAMLTGFAIHFATWLFGCCEIWMALGFMGHPVSIVQALVLESLGQAVKGAAFAVPGAYGIQEGGFIALCALFGIHADAALALSFVKRVPDFALGLPGLLVWQSLEGHRLWKKRGQAG